MRQRSRQPTLGPRRHEHDDHAEEDDAGGGDINDEPQLDESDNEPGLGSLENVAQSAWASGDLSDREFDFGNIAEDAREIIIENDAPMTRSQIVAAIET